MPATEFQSTFGDQIGENTSSNRNRNSNFAGGAQASIYNLQKTTHLVASDLSTERQATLEHPYSSASVIKN